MSITTVKVLATIALKSVFEGLEPEFARQAGCSIALEFAPPVPAARRVLDGDSADVVVTTPEQMEGLGERGMIVKQTSRCIANMLMGVAVRVGDPVPDIGTVESFRQAVLDAPSIVHANPASSPSAAHFISVAKRLGIEGVVAGKTTILSGLVARAVASGECAMAVQQLAELMQIDGIRVVGPFPAELQNVLPLSAAVHSKSSNPVAANTLIDMLASSTVQDTIEKHGLLRGSAAGSP